VETAAVAAATVARALRDAGLIVIHEERRRRPAEDLLIGADLARDRSGADVSRQMRSF
jgi:hypothetical protein